MAHVRFHAIDSSTSSAQINRKFLAASTMFLRGLVGLSLPHKSLGFQVSRAGFDRSGEHRRVRTGKLIARGAGERLVRIWVNHLDG